MSIRRRMLRKYSAQSRRRLRKRGKVFGKRDRNREGQKVLLGLKISISPQNAFPQEAVPAGTRFLCGNGNAPFWHFSRDNGGFSAWPAPAKSCCRNPRGLSRSSATVFSSTRSGAEPFPFPQIFSEIKKRTRDRSLSRAFFTRREDSLLILRDRALTARCSG